MKEISQMSNWFLLLLQNKINPCPLMSIRLQRYSFLIYFFQINTFLFLRWFPESCASFSEPRCGTSGHLWKHDCQTGVRPHILHSAQNGQHVQVKKMCCQTKPKILGWFKNSVSSYCAIQPFQACDWSSVWCDKPISFI